MAHRQLSSLLCRVRRPLVSCGPLHHRPFRQPLDSSLLQHRIADDPCFYKIGKQFFSATSKPSQRQTGGKATDSPEKVASSQKQSSGKSVPLTAAKASLDHPESSVSSGKSFSSNLLVVGACSALVVGLLSFYWDSIKLLYVGEKKKDPEVLFEEANPINSQDVSFPTSKNSEAREEIGALNELKQPHVEQNQESSNEGFELDRKEAQDGETENADYSKTYSASPLPTKTELESSESVSPANDSHVDKQLSAEPSREHKTSEPQLKDDVSHMNGQMPAESLLPANLSTDSKSNQLSVTSEKDDEVLSSSYKQSESLPEVLANDKEPEPLQAPSNGTMRRPSLFEAYHLANLDGNSISMQEKELVAENEEEMNSHGHEGREKFLKVKGGDVVDRVPTESVHNAFELLEIVHAAEQRQAELDAHFYGEVQKRLKQQFQQEVKDAQAKELMYAEEANRLAKEIELEKEKAAVALELEQNKARERLHRELKHKEEETDLKLKKAELFSKTQIAAAVAEEKLSYLKDVKDAKGEIEALYMAFFTQSEDVRQSHTVHKLAVGTFALEDAMKRGTPVEKEVALICSSYGGAGSDPLLDAVISSIPEQVIKKGTMTPSQLQQKFETMKGGVLELSMIPATGGGLLSHAAAKMVSILKVKENGQYSDGMDAVVSQVQRCLTDGKLADAAELLEKGVHGTEAEVFVADWIKCARDRAVMEQILLLVQAHATAIVSSLA
eukprot:c1347_g1_i1 orf=106-2289(+)